jgi:ankyrin repeat protein
MAFNRMRLLLAAIVALIAVPVVAQIGFSESYTFLKAVRERDGAKVDSITSNPSTTVINARDRDSGEGALHIVTRGRDLNWLVFLLARRARPDIGSSDGTTPLMIAAQIGWRDGAEQLIARGATVNASNSRGETPLMLAVQRNDLPMVRLLLSQGADPNQTDNVSGNSAIDYARQGGARATSILRALEAPAPRPAAPGTTTAPRPPTAPQATTPQPTAPR